MGREELARKCAQIEKAGGSVRDFLAGIGCISPWGTWFRLQKEELGRKDHQITDGRGNEMSKITLEQKKKAVEMAIRGESPLPYLKKCGSTAPDKTWWYIKTKLKDADPELYAKIPDMRKAEPVTCCAPSTRKGVEVPEELPEEELKMPAVDLTIPAEKLISTEDIQDSPWKPVNYDGFEVMALKSPATGFRFTSDQRYGTMTWNTASGDEVSLTAEEWRELAAELPKVLQIFGI